MAVDFIKIDTTVSGGKGGELRNSIATGKTLVNTLSTIKAEMDEMVDGTDYTAVETYFNLPAGQGETVYNLVSGGLAAMDVPTFTQMLYRLG
jgi:hypothetical protein